MTTKFLKEQLNKRIEFYACALSLKKKSSNCIVCRAQKDERMLLGCNEREEKKAKYLTKN
jgi:hypothetical protein